MADRISIRPVVNAPVNTQTPTLEPQPLDYWAQPKGLNYTARLSRVGTDYAVQSNNMKLDSGVYVSRAGSVGVGAATTNIVDVVNFVTDDGVGYLLRFRTTGVEFYTGSAWVAIGGATLTGGINDRFSYTAYGRKLYFTNGVDGIFEYSPDTGVIVRVAAAPKGKYLTSFAGRIIISFTTEPNQEASRIQWSAKNNSLVYDATIDPGAGFEDLLSVPGGEIDASRGVWPISDTTALVLRSRSVWSMTETGLVDAPFRFSRIYSKIGTNYPYSVAAIPGSIIGIFNDNVYIISDQSIQPIADTIKDQLFAELLASGVQPRGVYDAYNYEYTVGVGSALYTYHMREQGWTRRTYPWTVQAIEYAQSEFIGLTMDSALGTFDNPLNDAGLPENGSIDSEVAPALRRGLHFGSTTQVYKEDEAVTTDNGTNSAVEIWSGILQSASVRERTRLVEIQMEYECSEAQTVLFETSTDGGVNWTSYGQVTLAASTVPRIARAYRQIESRTLQFRARSTTLGKLRVLVVSPMVSIGARVAR